MRGIHVSKGVKCHVRTSQDLADLQLAEMMKILTIDEISEITGLSWSSCQCMLTLPVRAAY